MTVRKILVLALAFSTLPAVALADPTDNAVRATPRDTSGSSQEWPSFSDLDRNGSGFIEQGEDAAAPHLGFKISDTDDDGRLSRQEYESASRGNPMPGGEGGGGTPSLGR